MFGVFRERTDRGGQFSLPPVAANGQASTYLVFMVPVKSTGFKLLFSPFLEGYVGTAQVEISLN